MHRDYQDALRAAAHLVEEADRRTRDELDIVEGHEEEITAAFAARVKDLLNSVVQEGVEWAVYTYIPTKPEEGRYGADLAVGINLKLGDLEQESKGLLIQAKINKNINKGIRASERSHLNEQCRKMLKITDESWVFAYGDKSTKIVRAQGVLAAHGGPLSRLQTKSVRDFFFETFNCDHGDRRIVAAHGRDLRAFAEKHSARSAMLIVGRPGEEEARAKILSMSPDAPAKGRRIPLRRPPRVKAGG